MAYGAEPASVLLGKAIEYYQGRKYHECILAFEKLRKHYQLNPRFTAYLGFSYYKTQQYPEAVEFLEESIPSLKAYSPQEQAVYLYACAESHFALAQYSEALPYYTQALPLTRGLDKADVNYHMAFCYYFQGTDSVSVDHTIQHFTSANNIYKESARQTALNELHNARMSQTDNMLRALRKLLPQPVDSIPAKAPADSIPTTVPADSILTSPQLRNTL